MRKILFLSLLISVVFFSCDKNNEPVVTVHCDGLVTDTAGTGDNGRVHMPNAFTPNGDGINDISKPLTQNIAAIQFSVYDENGNQVFTSSTIGQGWSTTVSLNTAVKYYYRIQATTSSNRRIGTCGELYKLACFPRSIPASDFFFEDQGTPWGFTGVTSEVMGSCP